MNEQAAELYEELMKEQQRVHDETGALPCENWPDLFFIEGKEKHYGWMRLAAINMCNECPLKNLCLAYALEANETYGIWGGHTASMRNKLIRNPSLIPPGSVQHLDQHAS